MAIFCKKVSRFLGFFESKFNEEFTRLIVPVSMKKVCENYRVLLFYTKISISIQP